MQNAPKLFKIQCTCRKFCPKRTFEQLVGHLLTVLVIGTITLFSSRMKVTFRRSTLLASNPSAAKYPLPYLKLKSMLCFNEVIFDTKLMTSSSRAEFSSGARSKPSRRTLIISLNEWLLIASPESKPDSQTTKTNQQHIYVKTLSTILYIQYDQCTVKGRFRELCETGQRLKRVKWMLMFLKRNLALYNYKKVTCTLYRPQSPNMHLPPKTKAHCLIYSL